MRIPLDEERVSTFSSHLDSCNCRVFTLSCDFDVDFVICLLKIQTIVDGLSHMVRVCIPLADRSPKSISETEPDTLKIFAWLSFEDQLRKLKVWILRKDAHVLLQRPVKVDFARLSVSLA